MKIRGWGASDVGRKRDHNEDSFLCNDELKLYAVADGMGGHLGGERASRMAVDIIERTLAAKIPRDTTPMVAPHSDAFRSGGSMLRSAVVEADRAIYENALGDPAVSGMGTTLTALLFAETRAHIGHVGDSRAYLYRDGKPRQLTDDHSWIQDQVRAGLLSPEEAKDSRFRNIITRSVGFEPSVQPDMYDLIVQAGDCFVLCPRAVPITSHYEGGAGVLTPLPYRDPRGPPPLPPRPTSAAAATTLTFHLAYQRPRRPNKKAASGRGR